MMGQPAGGGGTFPAAFADWSVRHPVTCPIVASTLSNFPVVIDLGGMSATWWAAVKNGGGDIRVTQSDGETEVPIDVVFCDTGTETGELHFKATDGLSNSVTRTYYIYAGNAAASLYADTDTYGANSVWSEYAAVYHLQEAPNNDFEGYKDSAGNAPGTGVSMALSASSPPLPGNGAGFDGSSDYIDVQDTTTLDGNTAVTFSGWFYFDTLTADASLLRKWRAGAQAYIFNVDSSVNTAFQIAIKGANGSIVNKRTSSGTLTTGEWEHLAGAWYGANSVALFKNGVSQSLTSLTNDNPNSIPNVSENLALGCRYNNGSPDNFFDGMEDEVRIYSAGLNADWIATEYANQSGLGSWYTVNTLETN
jgi:hypothetical protein